MSKRIPKTGPSKPASSKKVQKTLQLPSKADCDICTKNMIDESYNNSLINEHLTSKEKVVNFDAQIYWYERIHNDAIQNHLSYLKRLKQIELDKIAQQEASDAQKKIKKQLEQDEFVKLLVKITFQGGKGDYVKNAAHYFFNPNNPNGLRLSVKQIPHIANMLGNNFKAEDESLLSLRTTKSGLREGFNIDKNGVISIK